MKDWGGLVNDAITNKYYADYWKKLKRIIDNNSLTVQEKVQGKKDFYRKVVLTMYKHRKERLFITLFLIKLRASAELGKKLGGKTYRGLKVKASDLECKSNNEIYKKLKEYSLFKCYDIVLILDGLVEYIKSKNVDKLDDIYSYYRSAIVDDLDQRRIFRWLGENVPKNRTNDSRHTSESVHEIINELDRLLAQECENAKKDKINTHYNDSKKYSEPQRNFTRVVTHQSIGAIDTPCEVVESQFETIINNELDNINVSTETNQKQIKGISLVISELKEINKKTINNITINKPSPLISANDLAAAQKDVRVYDLHGLIRATQHLRVQSSSHFNDLFHRFKRNLTQLGATDDDFCGLPSESGVNQEISEHDAIKKYNIQREELRSEIGKLRSGFEITDLIAINSLAWEIPDTDMRDLLIIFRDFDKIPYEMRLQKIKSVFAQEFAKLGVEEIAPSKSDNVTFKPDLHHCTNNPGSLIGKKISKTLEPGFKRNGRVLLAASVVLQ